VAVIPLGPWPEGQDTLHSEYEDVFQIKEGRPARAQAVQNLDLNNDGWPELRSGSTEVLTGTANKNVFVGAGLILFQDGGTIYRAIPGTPFTTSSVVTGLDADAVVEFYEFLNTIWYTNGIVCGRILSDGTASHWGCSVPPIPTLGTQVGTLRAGRYMVAATVVDADDVEHAAGKSAVITLTGSQTITATLSSTDTNAVTARFYATKPNGTELFFVRAIAVGSLPTTITDVEISEEPLRTQFLSPPIPGTGIFSFKGMIITFVDNYLLPSFGVNHHLFEITEIAEARPTDILSGAGLATGFWTVCETGAFWTAGAEIPEAWQTWQRDNREYAKGTVVIPGSFIPRLKLAENIALFVSEDGLMAGLPDGSLIPLTADKQRISVSGLRASFAYRRHTNYNQILFSLA